MSLPRPLVEAIVASVEGRGGTAADVDELVAHWEEASRATTEAAERIRAQVREARCTCLDGGIAERGDRCDRCCRRLRERR